MIIAVKRKGRRSEKMLRGILIGLSLLCFLQGILFSTAFMLPCFLSTAFYFWYSFACRREYEYTLEDGQMTIERVSDRGRTVLHQFPLTDVEVLALPDSPAVARYKKKGGEEKLPKFDYTSYEDGVPYYTMIAQEDGKKIKLLLDLTPEAISDIRRRNPQAVQIS